MQEVGNHTKFTYLLIPMWTFRSEFWTGHWILQRAFILLINNKPRWAHILFHGSCNSVTPLLIWRLAAGVLCSCSGPGNVLCCPYCFINHNSFSLRIWVIFSNRWRLLLLPETYSHHVCLFKFFTSSKPCFPSYLGQEAFLNLLSQSLLDCCLFWGPSVLLTSRPGQQKTRPPIS